ncbi:MAG TPA: SMP-30/gluconolactonase/LRE family protein [Caulobacteraceae bacterium]
MTQVTSLLPGRLLRKPGPPKRLENFGGVQIDDPRLAEILAANAELLCLYEGTLHGEGPVWDTPHDRLVWSDVPNRRLLGWYPDDGRVEVVIDGTYFMNGNALDAQGRLVHCEHGRRCISRSDGRGGADPIITHFEGKRLNSPNDITVAADGAIWFTDPTFGLLMPSQGSLAEPELDHRSVYRFDPSDGALHRMADFEQPNGLAFTPDGRTLYVSDTSLSLNEIPGDHARGHKHEIVAFDVAETGNLSNRRFFCHTYHGYPDGFLVDGRGWVWTTSGDGMHIFAPDRTRLGFFATPDVCSNCALGGARMNRLFIASHKYLLAIDLAA